MKKLFTRNSIFLLFTITSLSNISYSAMGITSKYPEKFESAIEYNDFIIGNQTKIIRSFLDLANIAGTEEFTTLRKETLAICDKAIKEVSSMGAYEGNTEFRDAAVGLFKFYKKIIEKEFNEMNKLLFDPDFNTESLTQISEMQIKITEEEKGYDDRMQKAQQAFAAKHGFGIEENDLQDEIDGM